MSNSVVEELAISERAFLHDIANHILVAQGMASSVQRALKEDTFVKDKEIENLNLSIEAITKMAVLLKKRRTILYSVTVDV